MLNSDLIATNKYHVDNLIRNVVIETVRNLANKLDVNLRNLNDFYIS